MSAQHFVQPHNAALKIVLYVEKSGVGIGDLRREREQLRRNVAALLRLLHGVKIGDCRVRPHCPVPEQAAHKGDFARFAVFLKGEACEQIAKQIIIVSCVERDLRRARRTRDRARGIQRHVAVERGGFDGNHALDFAKLLPIFIREAPPPNRNLQVKANHGHHLRDALRALQKLRFAAMRQPPRAEEHCIVAIGFGEGGFLHCLCAFAAHACDFHDGFARFALVGGDFFGGKGEHVREQINMRRADFKLCGVHGNGNAAHACAQIIA